MRDETRMVHALDEIFQFQDDHQRVLASQQYTRPELVARARKTALKAAVHEVEEAERSAQRRVADAVDGCIQGVERRVLKAERANAGVVGPVQMNRRYAAFLRMEDKTLLVKRIEQTLAFIEVKIRSDRADRVAAVYDAAGLVMIDKVMRLGDIAVCEPSFAIADIDDRVRGLVHMEESRASDLSLAIAQAFDDELGSGTYGAAQLRDDAVFADRVDATVRAGKRARLVASQLRAKRARDITGRTIEPGLLPNPPHVSCHQVYSASDLLPLLDEVKRAYGSYRRFVLDNGLFNAFGSSRSAADCQGIVEDISDELVGERMVGTYGGSLPLRRGDVVEIPELIEEDAAPSGDTLEIACRRMHEFNKRVYHGILDDEPVYFADVFWYGLKKLVQFSEGMVDADERSWANFVDKLSYAYIEPAKDLAMGMDEQQVRCFVAAVESLGDDA